MQTTIELDGVTYRRYPNSKRRTSRVYFVSNHDLYHRKLWEKHHGPVPSGYHVHHVDFDPLNNDIGNLVAIPTADHTRLHFDHERAEYSRKHLDSVRHLSAAWHASKEGIDWHKRHGARTWEDRIVRHTGDCEHCKKPIYTRNHRPTRYCSQACHRAVADSRKAYEIQAVCRCGATFWRSKYRAKPATCSRACGAALRKERKAI